MLAFTPFCWLANFCSFQQKTVPQMPEIEIANNSKGLIMSCYPESENNLYYFFKDEPVERNVPIIFLDVHSVALYLRDCKERTWLVMKCPKGQYGAYDPEYSQPFAEKNDGELTTMSLPLDIAIRRIDDLDLINNDAALTICSNNGIEEKFLLDTLLKAHETQNGKSTGNAIIDELKCADDNDNLCQMLFSVLPLEIQQACSADGNVYLEISDTDKYNACLNDYFEAENNTAIHKQYSRV